MEQYLPGEKVIFTAKNDTDKEFDFNIPEYLPGISRIIRTSCRIEKCSSSHSDGVVFLDLSVKFTVIYVSDFGGKIKCALFGDTFPIKFSAAPDFSDDCIIIPSCSIIHCVSRPTSPRKIHTRLSVISAINVIEQSKKVLYAKDDSESIHTKMLPLAVSKKNTLYGKDGEFRTGITLDGSESAVNELIFCDAVFCRASSKCSDGVIDYEADFILRAMYESAEENNGGVFSYNTVSLPYTAKGSIYDDCITSRSIAHVHFDVLGVTGESAFDAFGENRVIDFDVKYSVSGIIHTGYEVEITYDAFSDRYEYEGKKCGITEVVAFSPINITEKISDKIRADTGALKEISDCFPRILSVSYENSSGKFFAAVKCALEFFGTNGTSELSSIDAITVIHIPIGDVPISEEGIYPEVILSIGSVFAEIKEGEIICSFTVHGDGYFFKKISCDAFESFSEDTQNPVFKDESKVVVCYPSKEDTIWDVAKRYRVSPEKLREINGIEGENKLNGKTLLIP